MIKAHEDEYIDPIDNEPLEDDGAYADDDE